MAVCLAGERRTNVVGCCDSLGRLCWCEFILKVILGQPRSVWTDILATSDASPICGDCTDVLLQMCTCTEGCSRASANPEQAEGNS